MEINDMSELEKNLDYFDHPSEMWESKLARKLQAKAYKDWLFGLRPWMTFLTLTFRDDKSPDVANALFMRLIRTLNINVFGKHYTRFVSHSYFSYAVAMENQIRDVVHFHTMIDRPVNYALIHRLWKVWCGFAQTEIIDDKERVVKYVCKYISKGGEVSVFVAKKEYIPIVLPYWWKLPIVESKGITDDTSKV